MSKPLVIAEKKTMAEDIASCFSGRRSQTGYIETDEYLVTWASGHLIESSPPEAYIGKVRWSFKMLPIFPDKVIMRECQGDKAVNKRRQLKIVKGLMASSDHIVHAGDNDREGQLIVDELLDFYAFKGKVERLIINDVNKEKIIAAFDCMVPNETRRDISDSALARSIADWEVGMNLSPALALAIEENLGVGRVQTPILKLIYDRYHAIHSFSVFHYYVPQGSWQYEGNKLDTSWVTKGGTASLDDKGRISKKEVADQISLESSGEGKVVSIKKEIKKVQPPLGYTLDKFRSEATRRYKFGLKASLKLYQHLYEIKKVATYPRVECPYLPETMLADMETRIDAIRKMVPNLIGLCDKADLSLRSKIWNDAKVAEESHHALTFTGTVKTLDPDEVKVMTILAERLLMQFFPAHEYEQTTVIVEKDGHRFKTVGKRVTVQGWKEIEGHVSDSLIPDLSEGDAVTLSIKTEAKKTAPPKMFTEKTLVDALVNPAALVTDPAMIKVLKKSKGIGRPSTRDTFVPKLIHHQLVQLVKGKGKEKVLEPTEKGFRLIDMLIQIGGEKSCDPGTTALWETCFDKIAVGKMSKDTFLQSQRAQILEVIESAQQAAPEIKSCPDCEKDMIKRKGKNGTFYGCSGYPDCDTTLDENGVKNEKKAKGPEVLGDPCPKCKSETVLREGKFGAFYSCKGYPKCKYMYADGAPPCGECGAKMAKSKQGDDWYCRECYVKNKKKK